MINLEYLTEQVIDTAKNAGVFIKQNLNKINADNIETKSLNSYVTYVDKTAEKMIVDSLSSIFPEAGFIAEEGTSQKKGEIYNWIIDPLDGTTNFIHGLEPFAVSIALSQNSEIILGVVYEIGKDECFHAYKNSGAFLNGKKIEVSKISELSQSLIATGFPYYEYQNMSNILKTLDYFMRNTSGVRRIGSAATDLVYVACGRFEAFYESDLNPWDVAAGALIVKEAGGQVADFSGNENYIFGAQILAANNYVYDEFLQIVKKNMLN